MQPHGTPPGRDPALWRLARRRAHFKAHLVSYLLVNAGLWALWALTDRAGRGLPWPVFVSGFWGIGLLSEGLAAYNWQGGGLAEREYERLTRRP